MTGKVMQEWFLSVPWGKLGLVSWGDPVKPRVLLVHGFMDSAATFIPLVAAMPDDYYYVSFDLPGHGYSDPMPGPPLSYIHFVESMRLVVEHLRWDSFYCIAHSMGYLISTFYNAAFPGRLRRLVMLAGLVGIGLHAITDLPKHWFEISYANYYSRCCPPPPPASYTYEEAVSSLAKKRGISEELGAVLASRCLESTSDGKFRFTWDVKAKKVFSALIPEEMVCSVFSVPTPTLCFRPTEDELPDAFPDYTADMLTKLTNKFVIIDVPGGHNVHVSNPECVTQHILKFFNEDIKPKL